MINNHIDEINKLFVSNDWLYPSHSLEVTNGKILSFSVTGICSHFVTCGYKLGDDNMISCRQLLELQRSEFTKGVVQKINNTLKAILGEKQYRKFKVIPIEERPRAYLRANKEFVD